MKVVLRSFRKIYKKEDGFYSSPFKIRLFFLKKFTFILVYLGKFKIFFMVFNVPRILYTMFVMYHFLKL